MRDEDKAEDEEKRSAGHWAWRDLEDRVCVSWMTEEDVQDRQGWGEVPAEELVAKVGNDIKDFPHWSWRDVEGRICTSWMTEEDAVTGPRWKEVPAPPLLDKVGNVIEDIRRARHAYHHGFLSPQEDESVEDEEEVSEDKEEADDTPLRWRYLRDRKSAVSNRVKRLLDLAAEDSDDDAEDDDEQDKGTLSDQGET